MKTFATRFSLLCFIGLLACNGPNLKRNQPVLDASKRVSIEEISDPISFVENWILLNRKDVELKMVERILFDGKIYEAVVNVGKQNEHRDQGFLISFKKVGSKWVFLSKKSVALDYGWPLR